MNLLGYTSGVTTDGADSQVKATVLDLTNSNPVAVRLVDNTGAGVDITGGGDGAIVDGVSAAIRATVFSRTNSKALAVELVDTNGDPLSGSAVSIVDGGDVTEGAKADAAVLDATGTVNAHLRGVVKILADVWDSVNHRVHVAIDSSVAIAIAAGSAVIGHVITDTGSTTAVTGNVTTVQSTAASLNMTEASAASSLTSLQLIDDIVYTDDTSTHATGTSKGALMMAAATPTDTSVNANDIGAVAMTTDRKLHVSVQDALPAGTNGIGKLTANSGVTIGAVEIAAAQTLATVTTVSTVTTLTGGGVAHDGVDSGNPVKIGFEALNALPTAVSSADRANGISDLWGRQLVSHIDPAMQINKTVNYTSTQTGATVWTPTSGKKIAITSVVIGSYGTTAARLILWFGDSGDTTYSAGTDQAIVLASFAPSATVTPGLVFSPAVPIFCTTANREVHITTSAGMSVDVVIYGYEW